MRTLQLVFFLVGCAALAWMVAQVGPDTLLGGLAAIGWAFALTCSAHLAALVLDSVILRVLALEAGRAVPLLHVTRASVAGHALNEATPFGKVGEVTKYAILTERLEPARAAGSLVAQNLLSFVVNCALIALGAPIAILVFEADGAAAAALGAVSGAFFIAGAVGVILLYRGLGTWPLRLLGRVRLGRLRIAPDRIDRWQRGWLKVEAAWRAAAADRRAVRVAWLTSVASRLANVVEIALMLQFLGGEHVVPAALLSLGTSQAVGWILSFVPLQAGAAEGGAYLVFSAAGLPPHMGVLVEIGRKLRRVIFIALGVAVLGWDTFRRYRRRPGGEPEQRG
ncbi:MAG TPA: lysylphosphatidylglycerol synthase domain-containing protein [Kofleriaceae bacterium]|nr:lysylphosphatidylglycerol synthase domain-containing protein [Kofleriaceae bacterium]